MRKRGQGRGAAILSATLMVASLAGGGAASAGPAKRHARGKPAQTARVLSQAEIDAFLEGEEIRRRAAVQEREAHAAAVSGWSGHVPEAAELAPYLVAGGGAPASAGAGGRVHRAVRRRPAGSPPPQPSGTGR